MNIPTYEIVTSGAVTEPILACANDFESAIETAEDIARQGTSTYVWHTGYHPCYRELHMVAIVRSIDAGIHVPVVEFVGG